LIILEIIMPAASEFDLIHRYFERQRRNRPDVVLGIGDDCALLRVPADQVLVVTLDMLVAGVHFRLDADPEAVGHKCLAVNLSDLAAMGAEPAWVTLGIALPERNEAWLEGFCRGLFALADRFGVQWVGGDTTRGPLTVTIQAHGIAAPAAALRRDGARPGDIVCVTGTTGDAALALAEASGKVRMKAEYRDAVRRRLDWPMPRISEGLALRGLASAAIDVSDGLAQDLGHILARSGVGARLDVDRLPRSVELTASVDVSTAMELALAGGDDYELCFTVAPERIERLRDVVQAWECGCTEIGTIEAESGLRCYRNDGASYHLARAGYDHFP
jgi:thiamine-monophosphate kinase